MTDTHKRKRVRSRKQWAHVTNPSVGDLVRIKQIPGTRLASRRDPVWGVVYHLPPVWGRPQASVATIQSSKASGDKYRGVFTTLYVNMMPAPKKIPNSVKEAYVKYRLGLKP